MCICMCVYVCMKMKNTEMRVDKGMPASCSLKIIPEDQLLCRCKGHKGNLLFLMETKSKILTSLNSWNISIVN